MASLEERIQLLEDIESVKEVKCKYFYYADEAISRDFSAWKQLMDLFAEDAEGHWKDQADCSGKKELTAFFEAFSDEASFSCHTGHNEIVKVSGNKATGEWYLHVSLTMRKTNTPVWICGHYKDSFIKENGQWYFSEINGEFYYWTPFDEGWVKRRSLLVDD